jgi:hypothetical protein
MEDLLRGKRYEASFKCNAMDIFESIRRDSGVAILLKECLIDNKRKKVFLAFRKAITNVNHLKRFNLLQNFSKMKERQSFQNLKVLHPLSEHIIFDEVSNNTKRNLYQLQSTNKRYIGVPKNVPDLVQLILSGENIDTILESLEIGESEYWYKFIHMNELIIENVEVQLELVRRKKYIFLQQSPEHLNLDDCFKPKKFKVSDEIIGTKKNGDSEKGLEE